MKINIISIFFLLCSLSVSAQINTTQLHQAIHQIINDKKATVGVAFLSENDTITINNDIHYPVMSVFKFHVAITALNKMAKENIPLDSMIYIKPSQMRSETYSPLRKKYPEQRIHISYGDLIKYTISHSDNNTCDLLIEFVGGINKVVSYCKEIMDTDDFNFTETENSMHEDIYTCYNNWSTPLSMAKLLKKVYTENVLNDYHFAFLQSVMIGTLSGTDKIKAGVPAHVIVGHKTGHSDRTENGTMIAENDAGVIYLPNDRQCYIVVFIKDSKETDTVNAKIIADITKITYEAIVAKQ